jgi:hypothetical protein
MQQLRVPENKLLMYVQAESSRVDILKAHQELHNLVTQKKGRNYFGITFPDRSGKIHFQAGVTQNFEGEADALGLKTYILKKGVYHFIAIPDVEENTETMESAFKILILKAKHWD